MKGERVGLPGSLLATLSGVPLHRSPQIGALAATTAESALWLSASSDKPPVTHPCTPGASDDGHGDGAPQAARRAGFVSIAIFMAGAFQATGQNAIHASARQPRLEHVDEDVKIDLPSSATGP